MVVPLIAVVALLHAAPPALKVADGFTVSEFAGSALADDIYCMTIDPRGRIVVAGRGYIRILADDDADGRADRAIPFADEPADGAMGLLWEGDTLFFTGAGGVRRLRDAAGDDQADGPSELLVRIKTGGEHDAHALQRGPGGWLYVICGNSTGISRAFATSRQSPIIDPVAGCIVRFSPDFTQSEIVADGFRNPYDFDFDPEGELFAYDSDNERCVSLPWYEPTRFYHVRPGAHHGWLNPQFGEWWRLPPYLFDGAAPVCTLGRGSPTGVACYRHVAFPEEYRGGFFLADWTFGRVHFVRLEREGGSYRGQPRVFLEATGSEGFAPTDLCVHPRTGDLYVSIGGRGTRGAVFRVRPEVGGRPIDASAIARWQPGPREAPDRTPHPSLLRLLGEAPGGRPRELLEAALRHLSDGPAEASDRLVGIRLAQIALGDIGSPRHRGNVWEGYSPRVDPPTIPPRERARLIERLRPALASEDGPSRREAARTLAMIEDETPATLSAIVSGLTEESDPLDDIHALIVASRLKAPRTPAMTARIASGLLALDRKLDARGAQRDRHWPLRITELHVHLTRKDRALNAALLADASFGRPAHAVFTRAPGLDRRRAAEIILDRAAADPDYAWSAELVELIDELPAERSRPVLHSLWGRAGLDEAILPILARDPRPEDRPKFVAGLRATQPDVIAASLDALAQLPRGGGDPAEETIALIRALGRMAGTGREETALRERIVGALRSGTGQPTLGGDPRAWSLWLERTHPDWAAKLGGGADAAAWKRRLAAIDWSAGDIGRGRGVFVRTGCANCHSGTQAVGPDLAGVAGRFSREDLFTAIVDPSRDVPARYAATALATRDGHVYQGVVIYEAVDGVILQTGAATTVRVAGRDIEQRRTTDLSPMPAGLLDDLAAGEIADLDAYLRSLVPVAARGEGR
jgi:putative membrane-bound dehydrogenase-like protein